MPQISVIVPVYKVEPYLHRCVDSILGQAFTDFELILVDDGSPDNCGKICDEYAKTDHRIHVIHQENGGLSSARNTGIDWAFENSDSKWLSFVDSDDWIDELFLETLYKGVLETDTRISSCAFVRTSSLDTAPPQNASPEELLWDEFYLKDPIIAAVAWNKLYDKDLFDGLRYPVGRIHEDEFLTYKLLYKAKKVAFIDSSLYFYWQNPEGIMQKPFSLKRLDSIDAFGEQCAFLRRIGCTKLYYNRVAERLSNVIKFKRRIEKSEHANETEWRKAKKKLRNIQKRILLRDGKKIAPFKQRPDLYNESFPVLSWIYWTGKGISGKFKRIMEHSNGNH